MSTNEGCTTAAVAAANVSQSVKSTNRCKHCRKRAMPPMVCGDCNGQLCTACRLPEVHACSGAGTRKLIHLDKVVADKVKDRI